MLHARKIAKRPRVRKKKAGGVWGTACYSNLFSLKALKFLGVAGFSAGIFWVVMTAVIAADGSGTNIVSPTSVTQSSTGNTFTFTFTPAEIMDSGEIAITAPSGFSAPQGSAGTAGYTTVSSSAGTTGNILNALDSTTNWTATQHMSLSASADVNVESSPASSLSLSNAITATAAANEQWYFNYGGATDWGTHAGASNLLHIGMFLKPSVNTASGDISWQDDDTASLASPLDTVAIPALTANTWTYTSVALAAASRASVLSYGLRYTTDIGAATIKADSISLIFQENDSNNGWSGDTSITDSLITGAGNFKEGTGSVRCTYAAGAGTGTSGECWNNEGASAVRGPGTTIGFWVRSSVALSAGDFAWVDDDSTNLGSVLDAVSLPALSANTWTYVALSAPNSASMRSFGVRQVVDKGAMTIDIDAIGKVIDTADSTTGWTAPTSAVQALATDVSVFHENSTSLKNTITASAAAGDTWYETLSSTQNWSSYTTVGFWIRSTVATTAGQLKFEYSSASNLSSPIASINIGALSANTWTYQKLTLTGTRTSVGSYGVNYATDIGAATIYLDDVLLGPGSPTFPGGGDMRVRLLSAGSGQTFVFTYGSGGGTSGVTVPGTNGTYTFTTKSRSSDSGTLTSITTSPTVNVTSLSATKFVIINPTDGTIDGPVTVTVQAQRADNSVDTSYQSDVTLVTTGAATGGGLVNIVNGVGTLDISDTTVETVNLSLSDTQGTGLNVSSTQDVIFTVGATAQFLLNDPGNMTAGTRLGYIVTRKDQFGNLVTSGTTVAYLYSNASGSSDKFYDASSGGNIITSITIGNGSSTANFWYYDELAGSATISVSDNSSAPDGTTGVDDATDSVTVSAAAVSQFTLNDPGNMTAGTRLGYTVTRKDQFNNLVTSGSTTVYLYSTGAGSSDKFYDASSGGNIITSIAIGNGSSTANFWYYDELAGSATVTTSDNASAADGNTGVDDASDSVTISAAATSQFLLNNPGNMTAGTRLGYTVTREDQFGNIVTSGTVTVYLYSSSASLNKAFYDASSGGNIITSVSIASSASTANFWYYDDTAGTYTITASDSSSASDGTTGIDDGTDSVTVSAAPIVATRFVILNPTDGTVDASIAVTVEAQDGSGNIDTTYQSDVTLVATGSATGEGLVDIVNGVGTLSFSDTVAETVNLSLSDTQSTGLGVTSTQNVVFGVGALAQFSLNNPGDMTAGTRLAYSVTRKDQYGNLVTAGNTTVYLYSDATGGLHNFYDAASGGNTITSVTISSSTSSADFWYGEGKAGVWIVSASDNATAADGTTGIDDGTDSVSVSASTVSQFLLDDPGNMTAGTRVQYTVTRKDQFGNIVTVGSTTVYLYSNSSGTTDKFYDASSGGSIITSKIILNGSSTANFWYYDEEAGTWTITASDNAGTPDGSSGVTDATDSVIVSSAPIVATKFVIVDPADGVTGTAVTVTVRAQDNSGNTDTTYQNDVTLVASGSASGAGLVDIVNGVGTVSINDSVSETIILSLSDSQSTGLNAASTRQLTFSFTRSLVAEEVLTVPAANPSVEFYGHAYPGATISIVAKGAGQEQVTKNTSVAESDGNFSVKIESMPEGFNQFGLTIADKDGRSIRTQFYNIDTSLKMLTRIRIIAAPTFYFLRDTVRKGDSLILTGYGTPLNRIQAEIDNVNVPQEVRVAQDGTYKITVNTILYDYGQHFVRARQVEGSGEESLHTVLKAFTISKLFLPKTDLNNDGIINISDWSIFLFRWRSENSVLRSRIDLNGDGKITLSDLSIFMRSLREANLKR